MKEILLRNFRNYNKLNLNFNKKANLILGPNGVGKSNLLEAIYILAFGRSPWAATNNDFINFEQDWSTVCGKASDRNIEIKVKFLRDGKKLVEINGQAAKSSSELVGIFTQTLIGHQEIDIVRGAPADRRKLMDIHISQTDPEYLEALGKYNKTLISRNKVLERLARGGVVGGKVLLSSIDDVLIEKGAYLIRKRVQFIEKIKSGCATFFQALSRDDSKLLIRYAPSFYFKEESQIEDLFQDNLNRNYSKEISSYRTLTGPHRDDLKINLGGRSLKRYGSWGQARSASLAILLASAKELADHFHSEPILLLDDCFSDLDDYHSQQLLELAPSIGQTFITSPKPLVLKPHQEGIIFQINQPGIVEMVT
ncbi:DNA replication and repair protein RecF [bacterium]|nr:DNA replication and repair protein RecF [bacterium]